MTRSSTTLTHPAGDLPVADLEAWLARRIARLDLHPALAQAVEDALFAPGKRFRAVLVLRAAALAGVPHGAAYPLAGAIEMIHAYSLVHDDLPAMDDAALRRGRATAHRVHGEALAILAGDALLTDAFAVAGDVEGEPRRVLSTLTALARAAGGAGMVSGQTGDMLDLPTAERVDTVRAIHALKTGALIEWSLNEPVALWAPQAEWRAALADYARHLGVLYQVRDDLLDVDPEATADKDRDLDRAKSTYARLLGAPGAVTQARDELSACLTAAEALPAPHGAHFAALAHWTAGRKQ